jgi:CBS domain-containing protein
MDEEIIQEEEAIAEERTGDAVRLGATILYRPIRDLATMQPAICVPPTTSVRDAIQRMQDQGVGCVLVEEAGALVGIFTERDVLTKVVGATIDLDTATVGSLMTPDPEALRPDDRVQYALNKMSVGGFRHIPIIDRGSKPVGVLSVRDIVDFLVEIFPEGVLNLPPSPDKAIPKSMDGG